MNRRCRGYFGCPTLPLAESNAMPSEDRAVFEQLTQEEREMVYARFAERAARLRIDVKT